MSIQPMEAAGQSVTVSGYVENALSGERIPGANVFIPEIQAGATSNQYGFYSLTIQLAHIRLSISHVGYEPAVRDLHIKRDTTLIITLTPRVVSLDEVEVVAVKESALGAVQMSRHEIPIKEIETLPVILGEIDLQKTLQLLPSVQSGVEGSSGLYIRGGRADQNLILLDGLPVYNPSHLFGFLGLPQLLWVAWLFDTFRV
ncbi:MAG: TonB-dependent receptor, partial [Bacteroidota bacterium]|nr:TonB-dependent receptor [Bacteroidota bacterium]